MLREFRDAARPRTHGRWGVTIVASFDVAPAVDAMLDAMYRTVDFSACQATAGANNVERSCSRGADGRWVVRSRL